MSQNNNLELMFLADINQRYWHENSANMNVDGAFGRYTEETPFFEYSIVLEGFPSQILSKGEIYNYDIFPLILNHKFLSWNIIKTYFENSTCAYLTVPYLEVMQRMHDITSEIYRSSKSVSVLGS